MKTEVTLEIYLESLKTTLLTATADFREAMENLRDENPEQWTTMTEEEWLEQFQIYLIPASKSATFTCCKDETKTQQECVGNCGECNCE